MAHFFRNFLRFASLCLLLNGCGDGRVSVLPKPENNGKIPPVRFIERLEKATLAHDDSAVQAVVETMNGPAAEKLDWKKFWIELSGRPVRRELALRYPESIFPLHARDCESFPDFAEFVLNIGAGYEYILGNKRRCQTRLHPSLAFRVAEAVEASGSKDPTLSRSNILNFLTEEQSGGHYPQSWAEVFFDHDRWLDRISQEEISQGHLIPVLNLLLTQEDGTEGQWRLARVARVVLSSPALQDGWLQRFPFEEGIDRLYHAVSRFPLAGLRAGNLETLMKRVNASDTSAQPAQYLLRVARVMALARAVSKARPLGEVLSAYDELVERSESYFTRRSLSPSAVLGVLEEAWAAGAKAHYQSDLFWLIQRMDSKNLTARLESYRFLETHPLDRALSLLRQIYSKPSQTLIRTYCAFLNSNGVRTQTVSSTALREALEKGIDSRCIVLSNQNRHASIVVSSPKPLRASFASVIMSQDNSLRFQTPSIRLGTVFLSTTRSHPPQIPTPTHPSFNARVFPILIGFSLQKDTVRFKKGTYFFVYHFQQRKARQGDPEPVSTLSGFRGPDFLLSTSSAPVFFPFLSVGGHGQSGAKRRPGGQGDTSTIDKERVKTWLDALSETDRITTLRPIRLLSEINYDQLSDLVEHASVSETGSPKGLTIAEFVHQLPLEEKTKFIQACEETLDHDLMKADIARCMKLDFAKLASETLSRTLERSKRDALISRTELVPELSYSTFTVDGAPMGPENPTGNEGPPGSLTIDISKEKSQ